MVILLHFSPKKDLNVLRPGVRTPYSSGEHVYLCPPESAPYWALYAHECVLGEPDTTSPLGECYIVELSEEEIVEWRDRARNFSTWRKAKAGEIPIFVRGLRVTSPIPQTTLEVRVARPVICQPGGWKIIKKIKEEEKK